MAILWLPLTVKSCTGRGSIRKRADDGKRYGKEGREGRDLHRMNGDRQRIFSIQTVDHRQPKRLESCLGYIKRGVSKREG